MINNSRLYFQFSSTLSISTNLPPLFLNLNFYTEHTEIRFNTNTEITFNQSKPITTINIIFLITIHFPPLIQSSRLYRYSEPNQPTALFLVFGFGFSFSSVKYAERIPQRPVRKRWRRQASR